VIADPGDLFAVRGILSGDMPIICIQVETHRLHGSPLGRCVQVNCNHGAQWRMRETACQQQPHEFLHRSRREG
jgi:hypothetical protein